MKPSPLTLPAQAGAIQITEAQLASFGIEAQDTRGELETFGPWSLPVRFRALAVSYVFSPNHWAETVTLYGLRTMGKLRESGYCLEGRVSVEGRKRRGFTSSQLWQLLDGRLIETATIHVCP
jgi:hypothetical protein